MHESQNIEEATTAIATEAAPDAKTRRYDRQLRLWAASGQAALESCRILVISATATSTSLLKNLVLPGIGHFTIIDPVDVSPADAGNNFFLEGASSIGKSRAQEAVRLLAELNEGVEGKADTRDIKDVLDKDPDWIKSFSIVIGHNLDKAVVERLSDLLWKDKDAPPLVIIKSAGLVAEFFVQFHEHCIIESHSENLPTLRIDDAFPELKEHALSLDFKNMDITEHGHVPYVVILVRALEDWKTSHGGKPPTTYAEKQEFKAQLSDMRRKFDEENFDEAIAQAYRVWSSSAPPSSVTGLFDKIPKPLTASTPVFFHLLHALKLFVEKFGNLPLSAALPDMKADTTKYIGLQKMYKNQANADKAEFAKLISKDVDVPQELINSFVKNAHHVQVLGGYKYGALDADKAGLANAVGVHPKATSAHLALAALTRHFADHPPSSSPNGDVSVETLTSLARDMLGSELPDEFADEAGEIARAPTADLPNTAAFMGGLVAQEVIKMITKQYVPANGYVVVDLVDTWTAVVS